MKLLKVTLLYTVITAVLLGVVYPLAIMGIAQLTMRNKAKGEVVGSALIGQTFPGRETFTAALLRPAPVTVRRRLPGPTTALQQSIDRPCERLRQGRGRRSTHSRGTCNRLSFGP